MRHRSRDLHPVLVPFPSVDARDRLSGHYVRSFGDLNVLSGNVAVCGPDCRVWIAQHVTYQFPFPAPVAGTNVFGFGTFLFAMFVVAPCAMVIFCSTCTLCCTTFPPHPAFPHLDTAVTPSSQRWRLRHCHETSLYQKHKSTRLCDSSQSGKRPHTYDKGTSFRRCQFVDLCLFRRGRNQNAA